MIDKDIDPAISFHLKRVSPGILTRVNQFRIHATNCSSPSYVWSSRNTYQDIKIKFRWIFTFKKIWYNYDIHNNAATNLEGKSRWWTAISSRPLVSSKRCPARAECCAVRGPCFAGGGTWLELVARWQWWSADSLSHPWHCILLHEAHWTCRHRNHSHLLRTSRLPTQPVTRQIVNVVSSSWSVCFFVWKISYDLNIEITCL